MSLHRCPPRYPRATFAHRSAPDLARSILTALAALVLALGSLLHPLAFMGATAYAQTGSVRVVVFVDGNRNGANDDPDPIPVPSTIGTEISIPVTLYTADNRVIYSSNAVTSTLNPLAAPEITFGGIPLDSYRVEVSTPSGYGISVPGNTFQNAGMVFRAILNTGTSDQTFNVGLRALNASGYDAGVANERSLDVRVWDDRDADGIQDADEDGLTGLQVQAQGGGFSALGVSGDDGRYRFNSLPITTSLQISVLDPPAGSTLTRPLGSDAPRNSDASLILGYASVGISTGRPGVNIDTVDIGYTQASVSGYIFRDVSADGFDDGASAEERLNGIVVELLNTSGTPIMTDTTRAEVGVVDTVEGIYKFAGIPPGNYYVRVPGSEFAAGKPLSDAANSPTDPVGPPPTDDRAAPNGIVATEGVSIPVTLDYSNVGGGSNTDTTAIFGFYKGSVGDFVWYDLNRDGLQAGEEIYGQNDVWVFLDEDNDGVRDTNELSQTTTIGGGYLFNDLAFGRPYTVTLSAENFAPGGQLEGVGVHPSNAFSATTVSGVTYYYTVTGALQDSQPITDVFDFGLTQSDIGNVVFEDANGNGLRDPVEERIPGVQVVLYRVAGNTPVLTRTTDATGVYALPNLPALPSYAVFDLSTAGVTYTNHLASPLIDPDVNPQAGAVDYTDLLTNTLGAGRWRTPVFTPTIGAVNNGVDAGFYKLGAVTGRAFFDTDQDRSDSLAPEPGMRRVTVNLYDALAPTATPSTTLTLNDATGAYTFTNVRPGSYLVEFINPVASTYAVITGTATTTGATSSLESDVVTLSTSDGRTDPVPVLSGATSNEVDAGFQGRGVAGGWIFTDVNGDDLQSTYPSPDPPPDTPLPGATVALTVTANLPNLVAEYLVGEQTSGITDTENYSFALLPFGAGVSYTLTFTEPTTLPPTRPYLPSTPNASADAVDSDGVVTGGGKPTAVIVNPSASADADQGFYQEALVEAIVFEEIEADPTLIDNQFDGVDDLGIEDVSVTIERAGGSYTRTLTTTARGLVTFKVKPGDYQLNIDQNDSDLGARLPSEPNFSDPVSVTNTPLVSNESSLSGTSGENSFGYNRNSAITGTIFFDRNGDGRKLGEPGVGSVEVGLVGDSGTAYVMTTDLTGVYTFTWVVPDVYTLTFTNPANPALDFFIGGESTLDGIAGDDSTATINLGAVAGSNLDNQDVGMQGVAAVGGLAFEDGDFNGRSDDAADAPLGGVTVMLTVTVELPSILSTTILTQAVTPAGTGVYSFTGLAGGGISAFDLSFTPPDTSWNLTTPDVNLNANDAVDSDGNLLGQPLAAGDNLDLDQGYYQYATIVAQVFDEQQAVDDTWQAGEPGFDAVDVGISPADKDGETSQTTGPSGVVTFTLTPKAYTITPPAIAGFTPSPLNTPVNLTMTSGLSQTVNFGYYKPNQIVGAAWFDSNRDGKLGADEPGMEGITVTLRSGVDESQLDQQLTDITGVYTFIGVKPSGINGAPASYQICFDRTAELTYTAPLGSLAVGDDSDAGSDGCTAAFPLPDSNGVYTTADAGYLGAYSIGNLIWGDINSNGIQDPGEPGLPNVVVTVAISTTDSINTSGPTVVMTSTVSTSTANLMANYQIPGVPRATGFRVVSVTALASYVPTLANQGTTSEAGDSDTVGDSFGAVPPNAVDTDFGLMSLTSVGDLVWLDLNEDGRYDSASEAGVPGLLVALLNDQGQVISTTTTASGADAGRYIFKDVPAGTYQLSFDVPFGYVATDNGLGSITDNDDNDMCSDGATDYFTLTNGQLIDSIDAGLIGTGGISGIAWLDQNRNDRRDASEGGRVAGVQVTLTLTPTLASGQSLTRSATTAAFGSYAFGSLPEGEAVVRFTGPVGHFPVTPNIGPDTNDSDGPTTTVILLPNQQIGDMDMGYRTLIYNAFVPMVYAKQPQADLRASFTVSPESPAGYLPAEVAVTVTNDGIEPASNFWVDLYINPVRRPVVNDPWNDIPCDAAVEPCLGIAWLFAGTLQPGQSVTLISTATDDTDPRGYVRATSNWPGYFRNGTSRLYVLVDSWNRNASGTFRDPRGAVDELDETNNLSERAITVRPVFPPDNQSEPAGTPLVGGDHFKPGEAQQEAIRGNVRRAPPDASPTWTALELGAHPGVAHLGVAHR